MTTQKIKTPVCEQLGWVWGTITYGLLILHAIVAANNELRNGSIESILALTTLLAFWYVPFIVTSESSWRQNLPRSLLYQLIGWILWIWLIFSHSAALMLAGIFYPILFSLLPIRWAIPSASLLTLSLFLISINIFNANETWRFTFLLVSILTLITAATIGLFIDALIKQSHDRQHLVDELTQTRADLLKMEREAGILAERQRLAREIHDTLAQDFTSIVMHLTATQLNSSTSQVHIQQAEQAARDGLDEARRIVWAMRPEQLEHSSLVESIERLAARFSAENSIRVANTITGAPRPLGPEKEAALLRVAQEALNNVKKHAQAQQVNITLSYMPDLVVLDIFDNGIGFEKDDHSGFGLKTMRERVEEFNGTLTIESVRNSGTAIAASLPLEDA